MRDIIVIGAPVGGAAALMRLTAQLPASLDASVFIVLHSDPDRPILLADVLNAPGRMRAADAVDGERVERRRIYVAADGHHLRLRDGQVHLSVNGSEAPHRPSIDVLFTSAAEAFNVRVIAVLLLHAREEGVRGLEAIRKAGGRAITQRNDQMPERLRHPETSEELAHDHLELEEIAPRLLAYCEGKNGNGNTAPADRG